MHRLHRSWGRRKLVRCATLASLAAIVTLAACRERVNAPTSSVARVTSPRSQALGAPVDLHPYEAGARSIGEAVPSFAGMTIDTLTGDAIAFVTDLVDSASAKALVSAATDIPRAMARQLGKRGGIRAQGARYRFLDLARWRDSLLLWEHRRETGIVYLDLNEDRNLVEVGVAPEVGPRSYARIRAHFQGVGGENGAIHVFAAPELRRSAAPRAPLFATRRASALVDSTLRSYIRPVRGGTEVVFYGMPQCTLGFVLKFDNLYYASTVSHCSDSSGFAEGSQLSQGGWRIGQESYDHAGYYLCWGGVCHSNERWSEANLSLIDDSVSVDFGRVAIPRNNTGSIDIDPMNPYLTIGYVEPGNISNGWFVYHVGRTSGWRYGYVTHSCIDATTSWNTFNLHCQFAANFALAGGDSGGPVIAPYNNGWMAVGVLWGAFTSGDGGFSGFRGIDYDLTGSMYSGRLFVF
jgi:hypothetical protein